MTASICARAGNAETVCPVGLNTPNDRGGSCLFMGVLLTHCQLRWQSIRRELELLRGVVVALRDLEGTGCLPTRIGLDRKYTL